MLVMCNHLPAAYLWHLQQLQANGRDNLLALSLYPGHVAQKTLARSQDLILLTLAQLQAALHMRHFFNTNSSGQRIDQAICKLKVCGVFETCRRDSVHARMRCWVAARPS